MKFGLSKDSPRYLEHTSAYFQLKFQIVLTLFLNIKRTTSKLFNHWVILTKTNNKLTNKNYSDWKYTAHIQTVPEYAILLFAYLLALLVFFFITSKLTQ